MFDILNYPSFLAAILIFQLVPGAGTIAILNATARNGVSAGLGAVLGTLTGDFVFMVAAAAGLAAIMHAHPLLFQALQWFGAAYLCWLGVQLLRALPDADAMQPAPRQSAGRYFRQACAVSLTNPKVMLFFERSRGTDHNFRRPASADFLAKVVRLDYYNPIENRRAFRLTIQFIVATLKT